MWVPSMLPNNCRGFDPDDLFHNIATSVMLMFLTTPGVVCFAEKWWGADISWYTIAILYIWPTLFYFFIRHLANKNQAQKKED